MDKDKAIDLIKKFLSAQLEEEAWYLSIKNELKAIVLYGSVAKGKNRPDSDIDVLLIVPLEIEQKYTQGEYFYYFEQEEINIVLRSIEKLRKLAEIKDDLFQAEIFQNSEIIWQKDNEVRALIEEITSSLVVTTK